MLGKPAVVNLQIKSTILGGVQVRIENLVFDHSLKEKFKQFQRHWLSSFRHAVRNIDLED